MTTVARPTNESSCHWYFPDGKPCYEVSRASGEGTRPTTLADARKLRLLPSVTTILNVLRKPQLETWLIENAVLAALTTPRPVAEPLDAFVERVLHVERVQDQESDIAKKRGTEIHDAIEQHYKSDGDTSSEIWPWIQPVVKYLDSRASAYKCEEIVVSEDGFAGRTDLIQEVPAGFHIWDFKTTKKLPAKTAWSEHILQASAYAKAFWERFYGTPATVQPGISTGNIYISTVEVGKFVVCDHEENYFDTYHYGFHPLLTHWQWANNYHP